MTDSPFPDPDERLILEPDCRRCPALTDCRERLDAALDRDT